LAACLQTFEYRISLVAANLVRTLSPEQQSDWNLEAYWKASFDDPPTPALAAEKLSLHSFEHGVVGLELSFN
jgi:hypothetical protein